MCGILLSCEWPSLASAPSCTPPLACEEDFGEANSPYHDGEIGKKNSRIALLQSLVPAEQLLPWDSLKALNHCRGPDAQGSYRLKIPHTSLDQSASLCDVPAMYETVINFFGFTLNIRGKALDLPTKQPVVHSETGSVLLFNGEVYNTPELLEKMADSSIYTSLVQSRPSDTTLLSHYLASVGSMKDFCQHLQHVKGPYAFVTYHALTCSLIFGRDVLGRRSLLWHKPCPSRPYFALSSVVGRHERLMSVNNGAGWCDLPADGIYVLPLSPIGALTDHHTDKDPWRFFDSLLTHIPYADKRDEKNVQKNCVLFRPFGPINPTLPRIENRADFLKSCSSSTRFNDDVRQFYNILEASVRLRVCDTLPSFEDTTPGISRPCRLAVLFSGGIDCTVLAALAAQVMDSADSIDLLNVAFENPRKQKLAAQASFSSTSPASKPTTTSTDPYLVPDRVTVRKAYTELIHLYPSRTFRLVEINVPYAEMLEHEEVVKNVMFPCHSVMDKSIAVAFYFAARGRGVLYTPPQHQESNVPHKALAPAPIPYTTPAKVLLSGLGADEQLGGYSRHWKAFFSVPDPTSNDAWTALIEALALDTSRLPSRNLSRDDRVISHFGREVRYPYLDTHVVAFLASLPVWHKVNFVVGGKGVGDKLLLRRVARDELGLHRAAGEVKRAVQFGARSAKMSSGKERGMDEA